MSYTSEEEEYCIQQIEQIQRAAHKAAAPWLKRLAAIRSVRPPPPLIVTLEEAKAMGITIGEARDE